MPARSPRSRAARIAGQRRPVGHTEQVERMTEVLSPDDDVSRRGVAQAQAFDRYSERVDQAITVCNAEVRAAHDRQRAIEREAYDDYMDTIARINAPKEDDAPAPTA
jgi:hypothetical protein